VPLARPGAPPVGAWSQLARVGLSLYARWLAVAASLAALLAAPAGVPPTASRRCRGAVWLGLLAPGAAALALRDSGAGGAGGVGGAVARGARRRRGRRGRAPPAWRREERRVVTQHTDWLRARCTSDELTSLTQAQLDEFREAGAGDLDHRQVRDGAGGCLSRRMQCVLRQQG